MIDLKALRDDPERMRAALARRGRSLDGLVERIRALDERRRGLLARAEQHKAERNRASADVARRKKAGDDAGEALPGLKTLSEAIRALDDDLRTVAQDLDDAALQVPNPPLDAVPVGDASHNQVVRTWGEPRAVPFAPRPHWDLGAALGLFDQARGAKIAGSGFPLFTGRGARLVRALEHLMLELHTAQHGYVEVHPPLLVTADTARGTGQLPDKEGTMYVTADGLYLIPTAEVPVTNMHRDEILRAEQLPLAYVAATPCFRREAGAHGKETRGLIRVHQFDKVELVRLCRPEDSPAELERLLGHAEAVLQTLQLPYRVVRLATGDLGFASAMTYDVDVWAPGVAQWLEVSSVSTFTDFQARRAGIRYRPSGGGATAFVHTLNASGVAFPRTIIALLEHGQQVDGTVMLPEALARVAGFDRLAPT